MKSIMITNAEKMAPAVTQLASDATQIELPHTRKWSGRWEAAIPRFRTSYATPADQFGWTLAPLCLFKFELIWMNFSKYAPDLRNHEKLKHEVGEDEEIGSVILLYLSGRSIGSTAAWGASSVQQSSRWADAIYWPDAPIGWPHLLIVAVLGARVLSGCVGGSLRGPGRLEDPSFSFISSSRCALTSPAEEKKKIVTRQIATDLWASVARTIALSGPCFYFTPNEQRRKCFIYQVLWLDWYFPPFETIRLFFGRK